MKSIEDYMNDILYTSRYLKDLIKKNKFCPICNKDLQIKLIISYYEEEKRSSNEKIDNITIGSTIITTFKEAIKSVANINDEVSLGLLKIENLNIPRNSDLSNIQFPGKGLTLNFTTNTFTNENDLSFEEEVKIIFYCYNEETKCDEYLYSGSFFLLEKTELEKIGNETNTFRSLKEISLQSKKSQIQKILKISPINFHFEVITIFEIEEDKTVSVAKITNLFNKYKTLINMKSSSLDKLIEEQKLNGDKVISNKLERELTPLSYWKLNTPHKAFTRINNLFTLK